MNKSGQIPNKRLLVGVGIAVGSIMILSILFFCIYRGYGEWKIKQSILNEKLDRSSFAKTLEQDGQVYQYNDQMIHILCLGIAKNSIMEAPVEDATSVGQSDAVYLLSYDTKKKAWSALSIPRDTMVSVEMYYLDGTEMGQQEMQLTLQYAYGDGEEKSANLTKARVQEILNGLPIHRVCAINYEAVTLLNDAVGGVEIDVEEEVACRIENLDSGQFRLEGDLAIQYLRFRDITIFRSSATRVERQKKYLKAFLQTAKSATKKNPSLPLQMFRVLRKNMYTDLTSDEAVYLAAAMLNTNFSDLNFYTLDGETQVVDGHEAFYPDEEALRNTMISLYYQ
jgi:LCP family protein required for cell wall assembly